MAWDGLFWLDEQEVINHARTEAYAQQADAHWVRPTLDMPPIAEMLEDVEYLSPALDPAPWYDPEEPESADFYGIIPLDVSGLEDSSRTSSVIEATTDGGVPGRLRHATKSVVFSVALVGGTDKAVAYGMKWLRRVLLGDMCVGEREDHGLGTDLTFLSAVPLPEPGVPGPQTLDNLRRRLRRFSVNNGPSVTARRTIESCGGEVWTVQFTGVAGHPFVLGPEKPIVQDWLAGAVGSDVILNRQPDSSFELASTDWTTSAGATIEFYEDPIAPQGGRVARLEATASGNPYITSGGALRIPVVAEDIGDFVTVYSWIRWQGEGAAKDARITLRFLTSGLGTVSTASSPALDITEDWERYQFRGTTVPATTAWIEVRLEGLSLVATDIIDFDALFVAIGADIPAIGPHPDWIDNETTPLNEEPFVPGVVPGDFDNFPAYHEEVACGDDVWEPIFDPNCPALIVPPAPPNIPLACFEVPTEWDRRYIVLPADNLPVWTTMAPVITVTADEEIIRNARLRIYEDPEEVLNTESNPCAFASDMVVSYIPANAVLTIDASTQEVWMTLESGVRRRADSLVFATDSTPFVWPLLQCGFQHIVTLDTIIGTTPPVIDISFVPKVT